jgi:hypothetical protein
MTILKNNDNNNNNNNNNVIPHFIPHSSFLIPHFIFYLFNKIKLGDTFLGIEEHFRIDGR